MNDPNSIFRTKEQNEAYQKWVAEQHARIAAGLPSVVNEEATRKANVSGCDLLVLNGKPT